VLTQNKFRLLIFLYLLIILAGLIFSNVIGNISFVSPSDQTKFQKLVKQDPAFAILLISAPMLWLLYCAFFLFRIFSLISLAWFWKRGPLLFAISFMLSDICSPMLGWVYASQAAKYPLFLQSRNISSFNVLQPLNWISCALTGAILIIVYSSLGKHFFQKTYSEHSRGENGGKSLS
jgi:hypothetical protein